MCGRASRLCGAAFGWLEAFGCGSAGYLGARYHRGDRSCEWDRLDDPLVMDLNSALPLWPNLVYPASEPLSPLGVTQPGGKQPMRKMKSTCSFLVFLTGCIPGIEVPVPTGTGGGSPAPDPVFPACEGVPAVEGTDPCCAVHQCLLAAEDAACELLEECRDLAPDDVVCGDQLCDGVECSECPVELKDWSRPIIPGPPVDAPVECVLTGTPAGSCGKVGAL